MTNRRIKSLACKGLKVQREPPSSQSYPQVIKKDSRRSSSVKTLLDSLDTGLDKCVHYLPIDKKVPEMYLELSFPTIGILYIIQNCV